VIPLRSLGSRRVAQKPVRGVSDRTLPYSQLVRTGTVQREERVNDSSKELLLLPSRNSLPGILHVVPGVSVYIPGANVCPSDRRPRSQSRVGQDPGEARLGSSDRTECSGTPGDSRRAHRMRWGRDTHCNIHDGLGRLEARSRDEAEARPGVPASDADRIGFPRPAASTPPADHGCSARAPRDRPVGHRGSLARFRQDPEIAAALDLFVASPTAAWGDLPQLLRGLG